MKENCPYCLGLGQNYFYKQEQEAQSFACLKCGGTGIKPKGRTVVIGLHGIQSNSKWFFETKKWFEKEGIVFYAPDRRGSGDSRCDRGHIFEYITWLEDLDDSIAYVQDIYSPDKIILMGNCWGCKLALVYQILNPENSISGLVLLTPGLKTKVDLSLWNKAKLLGSWLTQSYFKYFDLPLKDEMFTNDLKYLQFIKDDHNKLTAVTSSFLRESRKLDGIISKRINEVKVPTLYFLVGQDQIVDNSGTFDLLLKIKIISGYCYPDSLHSIEFSEYREVMLERTKAWMKSLKGI